MKGESFKLIDLLIIYITISFMMVFFTFSITPEKRKQTFPYISGGVFRTTIYIFMLSLVVFILLPIMNMQDFYVLTASVEKLRNIAVSKRNMELMTVNVSERFLLVCIRDLFITISCWIIGAKKGFWSIKY